MVPAIGSAHSNIEKQLILWRMSAISRNRVILFSAGLILLLVGCGISTEDIDATVEARIASIPTPTPQIVIQEVEVVVEKVKLKKSLKKLRYQLK